MIARALLVAAATAAAVLAAGCLDKPGRPSGDPDGPVTDADPHPDASPLPSDTVFRRYAFHVADVNGDGLDDLLRWGNEAPGVQPRIWIWHGTETGVFGVAPDGGLDPVERESEGALEVLDVGVDDVDLDSPGPELLVMYAEDTAVPATRSLYYARLPNPAVGTAAPARTQGIDNPFIGGTAADPRPAFVLARTRTRGSPVEQIYGGNPPQVYYTIDAQGPIALPDLADITYDDDTSISGIEDAFDVDDGDGDGEALIVIGGGVAWRGTTAAAGNDYDGFETPLSGTGPRGASLWRGSPAVVATASTEFQVADILVDTGADALVGHRLDVIPAPRAQALGPLGGDADALDLAVIQANTLQIYADLNLTVDPVEANQIADLGSTPDSYTALAIGNFHGDVGLELYALGEPTDEPRCYRMVSATAIARCE